MQKAQLGGQQLFCLSTGAREDQCRAGTWYMVSWKCVPKWPPPRSKCLNVRCQSASECHPKQSLCWMEESHCSGISLRTPATLPSSEDLQAWTSLGIQHWHLYLTSTEQGHPLNQEKSGSAHHFIADALLWTHEGLVQGVGLILSSKESEGHAQTHLTLQKFVNLDNF